MGHKNKFDVVQLGTNIEMDNNSKAAFTDTSVPPEKRKRKVAQMQDVGTEVRSSMRTRDAEQTSIQNEKLGREDQLSSKRGLTTIDASMLMETCIADIQRKLEDFGQEAHARILSLSGEIEASRNIVRQQGDTDSASKLATRKDDLAAAEGQRDAVKRALAEQQKVEFDKKLKLERMLTTLKRQKSKALQDLNVMREEVDNLRKSEQAHKKELDEAHSDCERVRSNFVRQHTEKQKELFQMREEKNQLTSSIETMRKNLEEEKEKTLCQICLESPKDAICLPCVHLQYCSPCLEKHAKQNNTCPSCRTTISGVLKCKISI